MKLSMRTLGVLGGIGPQATIDFESRVHAVSQERIPQDLNRGYPPMVTVFLRHPPVLLDDRGRPHQPLTLDPRVLDAIARLGAWADLLVSPCNTLHFFLDELREAGGREVLSMIDATVEDLRRRDAGPVGLLGLGIPQVYAERFERDGIDFLTAAPEVRDRLDDAVLRFLEGAAADGHRAAAREAVDALRTAGARSVVLGCTEIPLLLEARAAEADLVNPTDLLARAAVRRAIEPAT